MNRPRHGSDRRIHDRREVRQVAHVHHFSYGVINPIAAYLLGFLGSILGLLATGRARQAHSVGRRNRWLVIAAFAIGGGAMWLMHFAAMFGFDVPASPVRYDPVLTLISLALAIVTVGIGLMVVGHGRRSAPRIIAAGLFTGLGVVSMHFTGTAAMHVAGTITYRPMLVAASAIIAVTAATAALWFTTTVRGWGRIVAAAAIMGAAVCGMHYTAMAAIEVRLGGIEEEAVTGLRPLVFIVPTIVVTAVTLVGVAMFALQAMTEEEFTDGAGIPRRGVHAETEHAWSLKHASLAAVRRSAGPRPSPRPSPSRPADEVLQPTPGP
jgi:NO-binding membrane sensor protein with MHYT domain